MNKRELWCKCWENCLQGFHPCVNENISGFGNDLAFATIHLPPEASMKMVSVDPRQRPVTIIDHDHSLKSTKFNGCLVRHRPCDYMYTYISA